MPTMEHDTSDADDEEEEEPYDAELKRLYYNPASPAAFGGVARLVEQAQLLGIPEAVVRRWLESQLTYTLHKPVQRNFNKRVVLVNGLDEQWQADLVDMQFAEKVNDGVKYLLTVIDVLSKYAWVRPLTSKTGDALVEAFRSIFEEGRVPQRIQTDNGTEFLNKKLQSYFRKMHVHHFVTYNETKAQIAERFNRTLKDKMFRYFQYAGQQHRYVDVLQDLVHAYNHSKHRSIKRRPVDVTATNAQRVWHTLYDKKLRSHTRQRPKFKVGDTVRLARKKNLFEKGYEEGWTEETFTVYKVVPSKPYAYRLKEYDGTKIKGSFYEQELQKVRKQTVFRIEKILKTRNTRRGVREHYVKWRGYPHKYNSWVPAAAVGSSVPT